MADIKPTRVVTERDYPLDEDDSIPVETDAHGKFTVLVEWDDFEESPTQAIIRLNGEAMENARSAEFAERQLRKHIGAKTKFDGYELRAPDTDGAPIVLVHVACGDSLAALPPGRTANLSRLIQHAVSHDCTIDTLLKAKTNAGDTGAVGRLIEAARSLCADTPDDTADSEYVRGVAEVLCTTLGIDTDRKDEVATWLCQPTD